MVSIKRLRGNHTALEHCIIQPLFSYVFYNHKVMCYTGILTGGLNCLCVHVHRCEHGKAPTNRECHVADGQVT